jgi:hypothetical protein
MHRQRSVFPRFIDPRLASLVLIAAIAACGDDAASPSTGDSGTIADASADGAVDGGQSIDCSGATIAIDKAVCAANAYLASLPDAQRTAAQLPFTDAVAKTRWSNLPGKTRNGPKFGTLSATSRTAALAVARSVLTDAGYEDFVGVLAGDDYLGTLSGGGGGGGGGMYSSDQYSLAIFGTPSATGDWMIQVGGHHMAYNVTFKAGIGYPTPHHLGVEPKTAFVVNGVTYQPLTAEWEAFVAALKGLSATDLSAAYLTGQFADVVVGPVEYEKGVYATASFPSGANRKGVLVSSLDASQKALVIAAISQWVRDYDPAIADPLLADYTSEAALADTYLAWGGNQASGVDPDVSGTYLRIDGPRLWLELSCQSGVVVAGKTHFHSIYRDKEMDYGKSL